MKPPPPTRLLTPMEVTHFYGLKNTLLREWRARGGGPGWCKIGRSVFYRVADLDAFIENAAIKSRPRRMGDAQ